MSFKSQRISISGKKLESNERTGFSKRNKIAISNLLGIR